MAQLCRFLTLSATVVFCSIRSLHAQAPIQYVYDELGRLTGVIDTNGDSAVYVYDAVGNLLSIQRYTAGSVVIIEFTPNGGPTGTTVTITGTGFSATPSQNTVTFNGMAATVVSSTTTQIVTTVPSGATTGPIAVTTPSGSATSATAFTIAASTAPTISSFTPQIGVVGTAVTITGTNFETTLANNLARINASPAGVTSSTATSIVTSVPPMTGSGRVSVSTPAGKATGADFFVAPSPFVAADVQATGRLTTGTPSTVSISTTTKIGLYVFDANAGQRVFLNGTNGNFHGTSACDVMTSINKPDASTLVSTTCMETSGYIETVPAITGTYTVLIDPSNTSTGSLTLTQYAVTDVTDTITAGGTAVTTTVTTPGQNSVLTLSGTAGQRLSVRGTNGSITGTTACDVSVSVRKPDGTTLVAPTCMETSGFIDTVTLPTTGSYTILVDPLGPALGSLTVTAYDVPADAGGAATFGTGVSVNVTVPGQNGAVTFAGTAGQRISIKGSGGTIGGSLGCDVSTSLRNPDGSTLVAPTCMEGNGYIEVTTLPTAGTYTIFVDPAGPATGSLTITAYDVPADITTTLTAGTGYTVSISTPGQNAALSFAGTANQKILVLGNAGSISYSLGCDVSTSIRKPDGTTLVAPTCMEGYGFIDVTTLPVTGTYTIFVDPGTAATGNLTITVYDVPADLTGTLTAGTPLALSITSPGQNAVLTFAGTAGQRISIRGTNASINWSLPCDVSTSVKKPDNSTLVNPTCMEGGGFIDVTTLPTTGSYTVLVDLLGAATGGITITVYSVPADVSGTLTINGSAVPVALSTPGQNAAFTFSGTQNQQVTVRVTSNTFGNVTVKLLKPDQTTLTSTASILSSFNLSTQTLPTTGTYTVVIDPYQYNTGSLNVSVTSP